MSHEPPQLSAHALALLDERCKREFALRYKADRYWPAAEGRAAGDPKLGAAFHLLVQQHALGLDVEGELAALAEGLPRLPELWGRFAASGHLTPPAGARVWTEQALHFRVEDVPVTVRYDRVVREGERWTILDWKTGRPTAEKLRASWQARLYRYALVAAGDVLAGEAIAPEAVGLVFWDVERAEPITLGYDAHAHAAIGRDLARLARLAAAPFDAARDDDPAFPASRRFCDDCAYRDFCGPRHADAGTAAAAARLPSFSA